jgi:hypothetical protein
MERPAIEFIDADGTEQTPPGHDPPAPNSTPAPKFRSARLLPNSCAWDTLTSPTTRRKAMVVIGKTLRMAIAPKVELAGSRPSTPRRLPIATSQKRLHITTRCCTSPNPTMGHATKHQDSITSHQTRTVPQPVEPCGCAMRQRQRTRSTDSGERKARTARRVRIHTYNSALSQSLTKVIRKATTN